MDIEPRLWPLEGLVTNLVEAKFVGSPADRIACASESSRGAASANSASAGTLNAVCAAYSAQTKQVSKETYYMSKGDLLCADF